MKKFIGIIAAALMTFSTGAAVYADMLVEPRDDGFYEKNIEQMKYINSREYLVLEDCYVYNNPLDREQVSELKKDDTIYMSFSYTDADGSVWGSYCYDRDNFIYGWVPIENVSLIYDHFSFIEEHGEETESYSGELDGYIPDTQVVIWKYPGSARYSEIWSRETWENWFFGGSVFSIDDLAAWSWTDEYGDKWIYIGYDPNGWVYLPDPQSEAIVRHEKGTEETEVTAPETETEPITQQESIVTEASVSEIALSITSETAVPAETKITAPEPETETITQQEITASETAVSETAKAITSETEKTSSKTIKKDTVITVTYNETVPYVNTEEWDRFITDTDYEAVMDSFNSTSESDPDIKLPVILAGICAAVSAAIIFLIKIMKK